MPAITDAIEARESARALTASGKLMPRSANQRSFMSESAYKSLAELRAAPLCRMSFGQSRLSTGGLALQGRW
jgi:hypothetical protein